MSDRHAGSAAVTAMVAFLLAFPAFAQTVEDGAAAAREGDPARAIAIWAPLAEAGDPDAQYWLAEAQWGGWWGVPENLERRAYWLMRAAEQGHVPSFVQLGHMYADGQHFAQDETLAAQWYARAAEAGNADGQYALGVAHYHGRGVARDFGRAYGLWREAAARGHEGARLDLCAEIADECGE